MGRRRKFGRSVNGVIVIDKPSGMTSNDVVQRVKRLFFAEKVGHTGSLDPLATGVLPICLGEATKFSQYLLDADKAYRSTFTLGKTTDTADSDGNVLKSVDARHITRKEVESAVAEFTGDIMQVPPMYSALKRDGQPLYKLARQGIEVPREARPVSIYQYDVEGFANGQVDVQIKCSKGTYIRSLAEELGEVLGVGAHVSALRRTMAGAFTEQHCKTLEALENERGDQRAEVLDTHLLPVDATITDLAQLVIDDNSGYYFARGQAVMVNQVYRIGHEGDKVRVFCETGDFLGIGEISDDGRVQPKRLVVKSDS